MGFRETVGREGDDLLPEPLGHLTDQAVELGASCEEPGPHRRHLLRRALRAHGAAQGVRLGRAEPRGDDGELHELFLEQRDTQGARKHRFQAGMVVGDLLLAVASPDVGVHRTTLDRAGPDERHLDDEVVEGPGLQPWQGRELGPGLDLEDAHRVRPRQHRVDLRVGRGELPQLHPRTRGLLDQVHAVVQCLEHAEAEQVELHQPDGGAVVLVPLHHRAVGLARPFHGDHIGHRPIADDHAAGVDAEVTRLVDELGRQVGDHRRRVLHPARPGIHPAGIVTQCPGGVPQRTFTPVGDDIGDLGGVVATVLSVDVLDHLLAAGRFDVEVDVRWAVPFRGEETFEQKIGGDGVHVGDPEGEADCGVRRRASALAEDPGASAEVDDVVDDEEVAGEAEALDDLQFMVDDLPGARVGGPGAVAFLPAQPGELDQPAHVGVPLGHVGVRQLRGDEIEGESALGGNIHTGRHGLTQPVAVPGHRHHLLPRMQPGAAEGVGDRCCVVDVEPVVQRSLRPGQPGGRRGRAGGRGRDDLTQAAGDGEVVEGGVAVSVRRTHGELQFDDAVCSPEGVDDAGHRIPVPVVDEDEPVAVSLRGEGRQIGVGQCLLVAVAVGAEVRVGEDVGESPVAFLPTAQDGEWGSSGAPQTELGAEDGGHTLLGGGGGEAGGPVEAVPVDQGQGGEAEASGGGDHVVGLAGAAEEVVGSGRVELGEGGRGGRRLRGVLPGLPQCLASTLAVADGVERAGVLPGEQALQPRPGEGCVVTETARTVVHMFDTSAELPKFRPPRSELN